MIPPGDIGCFIIGESGIGVPGDCPEQAIVSVSPAITRTIPSYLYWQYQDDDDLQAFVNAQNNITQLFVEWFNALNLPIYTGGVITGLLLDWVGAGLYGLPRPILADGETTIIGPLNTFTPNQLAPNELEVVSTATFVPTTDDVYRRILTWHFYKGDGKIFTIDWLKRRIVRFLVGGTSSQYLLTDSGELLLTDTGEPMFAAVQPSGQTYQVSVSLSYPNQVDITLIVRQSRLLGGCILNEIMPNSIYSYPNAASIEVTPLFTQFALADVFKRAVDSGALELPFQFNWVVTIQR